MVNCVVDLSHWNVAAFELVKEAGILGVIHKATQGMKYVDPKYKERKAEALDEGLLWGAYHFGVYGDGESQAERMLEVTNPGLDELLVLDWEHSVGDVGDMTLIEAENWAVTMYNEMGRWPVLYSGQAFLMEKVKGFEDTQLEHCPLWIARYSIHPPRIPSPWVTWTLHQYTDGENGPPPHEVPGVGKCDRDYFNGTEDELKLFWMGK